MTEAEVEARRKHRLRQREGHKTPDWEGLSEMMRQELIARETAQDAQAKPSDATPPAD